MWIMTIRQEKLENSFVQNATLMSGMPKLNQDLLKKPCSILPTTNNYGLAIEHYVNYEPCSFATRSKESEKTIDLGTRPVKNGDFVYTEFKDQFQVHHQEFGFVSSIEEDEYCIVAFTSTTGFGTIPIECVHPASRA